MSLGRVRVEGEDGGGDNPGRAMPRGQDQGRPQAPGYAGRHAADLGLANAEAGASLP